MIREVLADLNIISIIIGAVTGGICGAYFQYNKIEDLERSLTMRIDGIQRDFINFERDFINYLQDSKKKHENP